MSHKRGLVQPWMNEVYAICAKSFKGFLFLASLLAFPAQPMAAPAAPDGAGVWDFANDASIQIVVPEHPLPAIDHTGRMEATQRDAAERLQMLIGRAYGKRIPIVSAAGMVIGSKKIFVGYGPHLLEMITAPTAPEGIRIREREGNVYIVGEIAPPGTNGWRESVDRGTMHAVEIFAERILGYRFLFSSRTDPAQFELGTAVPDASPVGIDTGLDIEEAPAFSHRMTHGRWLDCMGLQIGSGIAFDSNHTHDAAAWKELYGIQHPEMFVLKSDGGRDWKHLDYAEPLVLKKELEHLDAYFERGEVKGFDRPPSDRHIMAVPTDGYAWPNTNSEAAKALLVEDLDYWGGDIIVSDSRRYSNLVFDYVRRLALAVQDRWPHMRVSALAYQWFNYVPDLEIPENVDIMLCLMRASTQAKEPEIVRHNLEMVQDWNKAVGGDRSRLLLWEYLLWPSLHTTSPTFSPHALKNWVQTTRPYVSGVFINGHYGDPNPYDYLLFRIWMRLLWNPDLDVNAEIRDICEKFFGPAGASMTAFYRTLVEGYEAPWEKPELTYNQFYADPKLYFGQSYTPERLALLASHLESARRNAGLDPALSTRAISGTSLYVFSGEANPVPVEFEVAAPGQNRVVSPSIRWDGGRITFPGTLDGGETLMINADGKASIRFGNELRPQATSIEIEGSLPRLLPGTGKTFTFLQKEKSVPMWVEVRYGPRGEAAKRGSESIQAKRFDWFRRPYQVFTPVERYNGMPFQTGFFPVGDTIHRHLSDPPEMRAELMQEAPLHADAAQWSRTAGVRLVRGRETPKAEIGSWDYLSESNALPYNSHGFPADRDTELKFAYDSKGLSLWVRAEKPFAGPERLRIQINGKIIEMDVERNKASHNPHVTGLTWDADRWIAVLRFPWSDIFDAGEALPATVSFQFQRDCGTDSYVLSPPIDTDWGHNPRGPGSITLSEPSASNSNQP